MARYVVFAVWDVEEGKAPHGGEVLDRAEVRGLRFAFHDGRRLSVLVHAKTGSADDAAALVTGRVALAWQARFGAALGGPAHVEVRPVGGVARVSAGLRRGPARTGAPSWPGDAAHALHRALHDPGRRHDPRDGGPDDDLDDPDDGGLAGVREPRRPKPGPGHLSAVAPLPERPLAG